MPMELLFFAEEKFKQHKSATQEKFNSGNSVELIIFT